jgi:D-xylose transport system substrate-binding protein
VDNGKEKVPSVLLPTIVITKGNIKQTVIKDGFLTTKQICTSAYAKACAAAGIQ